MLGGVSEKKMIKFVSGKTFECGKVCHINRNLEISQTFIFIR